MYEFMYVCIEKNIYHLLRDDPMSATVGGALAVHAGSDVERGMGAVQGNIQASAEADAPGLCPHSNPRCPRFGIPAADLAFSYCPGV
jgi:hypothetical protein